MRHRLLLIAGLLFVSWVVAAEAQTNPVQRDLAIRAVVASYEAALNAGDVGAITDLFTEDAVVMLQKSPTAVGNQKIRNSYQALFGSLAFDLDFSIVEVVQFSPDWALVRTASSGQVNIISSGSVVVNTGQELFILHKKNKAWRIARYAGSSTK